MTPRVETDGRRGGTLYARIGEFDVSLTSDLESVLTDFRSLYPQRPSSLSADHTIDMQVRRVGRSRMGRALYQVLGDGDEVGGLRRAREVFPFLEWGINLRVIARCRRFVQLHAASLVHQGKGCIFAGASGCGKSTLAAGLLARGWQYACDEFALIEPHTRLLHPFPKALCIKAGSFRAVESIGLPFCRRGDYVKGLKGRVGYVSPFDPRCGAAIAEPAPVAFVVFPQFTRGGTARLTPLSAARALLELTGCVFNRHAFSNKILAILGDVVAHARCFRLETADLNETGRLLEAELDRFEEPRARRESAPPADLRRSPLNRRPPSRRDLLRRGARLAYVVPAIVTLGGSSAFAAASDPSGICSTAVQTGGICGTDLDCCSRRCTVGICE